MESSPADRLPLPAAAAALVPAGALPDVTTAIRDQLLADIGPGLVDDLRALLDHDTFVLVLRWLSSAKRGATTTKRAYADDITRWAAWVAAQTAQRPVPLLDVVDRDAVTAWVIWARAQKMAVRTQRRRLSALSSLFTYASRRGKAVANPVDFEEHAHRVGTSTDGRSVGATRVLELADVAHMRAACRTPLERLTFDLLYACGLRVSIELGLERADRGLDLPAVVVELGELAGRRCGGVEQGGDQGEGLGDVALVVTQVVLDDPDRDVRRAGPGQRPGRLLVLGPPR